MEQALIKMLTQSAKNMESAYYWLEKSTNPNHQEALRTISVAEDLIQNAINQLSEV